jgi:hypothetical protein
MNMKTFIKALRFLVIIPIAEALLWFLISFLGGAKPSPEMNTWLLIAAILLATWDYWHHRSSNIKTGQPL